MSGNGQPSRNQVTGTGCFASKKVPVIIIAFLYIRTTTHASINPHNIGSTRDIKWICERVFPICCCLSLEKHQMAEVIPLRNLQDASELHDTLHNQQVKVAMGFEV